MDRLAKILVRIPSKQMNGMPAERAGKLLFSDVGGSLDEVERSLVHLGALLLVSTAGGRLSRTRTGDAICKKIKAGSGHELAVHLLRSGELADQIRAILSLGHIEAESLVLPLREVKAVAPNLFALMLRIPGVEISDRVTIGAAIVRELESAWNQVAVPGPAALRNLDVNVEVGERAELYSLQLETSAYLGASTNITWVSRDDPAAGYDIEVGTSQPSRCVEVKGSRGKLVAFILSINELKTASRLRGRYQVQFWGGIRLDLSAPQDFARLREQGYPVIIDDPANELFTDRWTCEPTEYRVRRLD